MTILNPLNMQELLAYVSKYDDDDDDDDHPPHPAPQSPVSFHVKKSEVRLGGISILFFVAWRCLCFR
jgi:hypothetical protein